MDLLMTVKTLLEKMGRASRSGQSPPINESFLGRLLILSTMQIAFHSLGVCEKNL